MSDVIDQIMMKHHSVRKFKNEPLSKETVKKLVEAGQRASTSSYLQTYSIIGITDPEIKKALREISGQPYVEESGYLFVFVMDYYRQDLINNEVEQNLQSSFESAEGLLVGTIDVALVAQNISIAAESLGLGMVYLGSLRNDVARVKELLNLPEYTFPLFGMALGVPADDENGSPKPRLPFEAVFHENGYNQNDDEELGYIKDYDKEVSAYYDKRTNGERKETWSEQIAQFLTMKERADMLDELHKSGFIKK
ncbi:oxygen-insensitive NADPH nitroreductase [Staphylococcus simulans]|uniref:oxygen-insensitive NADPH nitroreductase n=1 Tax=Staphylococcus simulans TaxID=1286 RepID=UPI000D1DFC84|nr:oxygen-insensitive NADPH nitroreductase [Staphylococcus simulans]PTJ10309.1 oxygen-insensitive NADPH nitroreductase [Staphylococcus simulans]